MENPVGQFFGFIAFWISVWNFLYCKDWKFILYTLIASVFWGIHFHIIGALTAAYFNYVDVFKNYFALKYEKNKKIMQGFLVLYVVLWIGMFLNIDIVHFRLGELNYLSLLVTFSALFSTFLIFKTRWVVMKFWFLVVVLCWLTYNINYWSIGWVMTDLTLLISGVIGIYKDLKEEKRTTV